MQYNLPFKTTEWPVPMVRKFSTAYHPYTSAISYSIRELDVSHLYEAQSSFKNHWMACQGAVKYATAYHPYQRHLLFYPWTRYMIQYISPLWSTIPLKTTMWSVMVATKNCSRHTIHTSAISYSIRELDVSHIYAVQSSFQNHCVPLSGLQENFPRHAIHICAISCSIRELDVSHLYAVQSSFQNHWMACHSFYKKLSTIPAPSLILSVN